MPAIPHAIHRILLISILLDDDPVVSVNKHPV